jgi:hypothetical protein
MYIKQLLLSVVLYFCETWSHIMREKHTLLVSKFEGLKIIFTPKRDDVNFII